MKFQLTLLSLAFIFKKSEAIFKEPVIPVTEFSQLHPVVLGMLDHTATVVFDHPDCDRCAQTEQPIQSYAEENQGFTKTYIVDCEQMWEDQSAQQSMPMCSPDFTDKLPIVLFFEPPQTTVKSANQQAKQHTYQGGVSSKDIGQFLRKHMPAYRETINSDEEYKEFLEIPDFEHKVILFTNKDRTSPLYKAISSTYRDRILFGEVHESVNDVVSQFKIEQYPALFLLSKQEDGTHKTELYRDDLKYDQIDDFLQDFALEKRVTRKHKTAKKSKSSSDKDNKQEKKQQNKQEKKEEKPEINKLNPEKFEKQILQEESPILIHITKGDQTHPLWDEIYKKYSFLFKYITYNVETDEEEEYAKEILKAREVPSIRFYPPGTTKKPFSQISFGKRETDIKEVHAEFQYQIPDHTLSVSDDQQLNQQFQMQLAQSKVVILYFYEKDISLGLRVASMEEQYQKKFGFISYRNPSQQIREQFGVQKLPAMVSLFRETDLQQGSSLDDKDADAPKEGEEVKVAAFQGKFNYQEISGYLNIWIQAKEGVKSRKQISEIENMEDFKQQCQGQLQCFVALLNGEPSQRNSEDSKLKQQLAILKRLNDRYSSKNVNFAWIDATCHSEILFPFSMSDDEIPNFIAWSQSKKSIAKMIGRYDKEALQMFIEKTLKGSVDFYPVSMEDFNIKSYKCLEQHEKIAKRREEAANQQQQDDDIESDILAEILAEEKAKQEALDAEIEDGKKRRKKKKKSNKKNDL